MRDSWWENMKRARAALLLISIFTETRIKNHAAINARCSNLIKPFVTIGERGTYGMLFRPCFLIRRKGSSSLPSPMEDKIEILSNSVWKKRICDRFLFLSFSILCKKQKKEIVTPRSRFQREGKESLRERMENHCALVNFPLVSSRAGRRMDP